MPERLVSSSGREVAGSLRWARSPWARMKGLIGEPELEAGSALVLSPASQVHSFFLRHPIDVVLCDARWRVVSVRRSMRPNRLGPWRRTSRYAVEMRAGSLPAWIEVGDRLSVVE